MDFKFIENQVSKKWVVLAPRRAKRPDMAKGDIPTCPFCVGTERNEKEVYRIQSLSSKKETDWLVRVILNKFPFAPIHEIVIHSPDHHKSFDEFPIIQSEFILKAYRERFNAHKDKGQVYIFHNHGQASGESLEHPHSQIVVIPDHVGLEIPPIDFSKAAEDFQETEFFEIFCPLSSEWPDEVWIASKFKDKTFGEATDAELKDLAKILYRLIQILDLRHGHEFPFNFYISPQKNFYLRIIPRVKILGGVELGAKLWVNTQDPKETIDFIKEHFESPDEEKIKTKHQAQYRKAV
jgi:UDPglucose--hexose-1-phosphate uridylyltransferase